jgi:ABC-type transporter MlaC component
MSFVEGKSLGSVWHLATDTQREALIKEICESLQLINGIAPSDLALTEVESWQTSIRKRGETLVQQLKSKSIIDD